MVPVIRHVGFNVVSLTKLNSSICPLKKKFKLLCATESEHKTIAVPALLSIGAGVDQKPDWLSAEEKLLTILPSCLTKK